MASNTPEKMSKNAERATLGLTLAGPILYGVALTAASWMEGRPSSEIVCFDPALTGHLEPMRIAAGTLMALGAVLMLFVAPWWLGTLAARRLRATAATAAAWSLAANSLMLVLAFLVLRNTAGIDRDGFLALWLAWTIGLSAVAWTAATERFEIWVRASSWLIVGSPSPGCGP